MVMISRGVKLGVIVVLAGAAMASCALFSSSPQEVQSSNPTVTYNYRTDEDLIQANQRATTYCSQYQTAPRTVNIMTNPDGTRAVHFECVRATPPASAPAPPGQSYSYRTNPELIQASQTADAYCLRYGSQPTMTGIVTNPDGSKTVTFQCGPR